MMLSPVVIRTLQSTTGMAVQGLARFGYTLVIGRLSGPETLGEITAILSLSVYMGLLWPAGTSTAATRYYATSVFAAEGAHAIRRSWLLGTVVLSALIVPVTLWMTEDLALAFTSAALMFSYSAYMFTRGELTGEDRLGWAAVADALSSALALTALLVTTLFKLSWAMLLPLTLGYLLFAVLSRSRTKSKPADPALKREIFAFSWRTSVGMLVGGGLLPITIVFVRGFETPETAGLFAAALSLATPASMISLALNQVLIPHLARMNPTDRRVFHRRTFVLASAFFALVFGALALAAPLIVNFVYGPTYAGAEHPMRALLLGVYLFSAAAVPSALLLIDGRERVYARIWLISFIVGMTMMATLSPLVGEWGTLAGYVVGGGGGAVAICVYALSPTRPARSSRRSDMVAR
ncbi:hypothetical protein [Microbacterium sp.]|uniref:lipopolysaccharide biosynthesis protein n=1 Tax=Microbacterium sp. TaxID=51671 RepID=UPI0028B22639|nr:hypothetical protein [Microbacterium sp.]